MNLRESFLDLRSPILAADPEFYSAVCNKYLPLSGERDWAGMGALVGRYQGEYILSAHMLGEAAGGKLAREYPLIGEY